MPYDLRETWRETDLVSLFNYLTLFLLGPHQGKFLITLEQVQVSLSYLVTFPKI